VQNISDVNTQTVQSALSSSTHQTTPLRHNLHVFQLLNCLTNSVPSRARVRVESVLASHRIALSVTVLCVCGFQLNRSFRRFSGVRYSATQFRRNYLRTIPANYITTTLQSQTDGRTTRHSSTALCIASRGKNGTS